MKNESNYSAKKFALRLMPGDDLYIVLQDLAQNENLDAAVVLSAVGSLKKAALRFADNDTVTMLDGPLEIVSVTGTVGRLGMHLHLAVSDRHGVTSGGHLMAGSNVYTTIELIVLDLSDDFLFERRPCSQTGFDELSVIAKGQNKIAGKE